MKIDVSLGGDLATTPDHAAALRAAGIDGGFTFEGNSDVFFPLVTAASAGLDLYTNVAIAFPRSPMHLAYPRLGSPAGHRWPLRSRARDPDQTAHRTPVLIDLGPAGRPHGRQREGDKGGSGRTGPTARRSITSPTSTGSI